MSYRALYRVWRPQQFNDLVGQEHVTTTLKNALTSGQLAHAYLFHGPRGTGKTSAAKILAKAVNCEQGPASEPCNKCDACIKITAGQMIDVVEIDAASNRGVDDIRELRDQVKYAPTEARYKVYIIDEAHMLTMEAFNALLKTLEEPPSHVLFLLATTEPHKLLSTILSRCQRFAFRRITFEHIVATIQKVCIAEGVTYDEDGVSLLARSADGGLRDALSLLDQALAFAGKHLDESAVTAVTGSGTKKGIYQLLQAIKEQETAQVLASLQDCLNQGAEVERIMDDLIYTCRDLLLFHTAPQLEHLQGAISERADFQALSQSWTSQQLMGMLDVLLTYQQQMKRVNHPYLLLEMVLVRLCQEASTNNQVSSVKEEQEEIAVLRREIQQLHKQMQSILQAQSTPSITTSVSSEKDESEDNITSDPIVITSPVPSHETLSLSPETLQQIKKAWREILLRVKERKITIHAWLMNCDPVAVSDNRLILLFSSRIHRDTVERIENKQVIEQVIYEAIGISLQIQSLMTQEWNAPPKKEKPSLMNEEKNETALPESPTVNRAIQLFGSDLVEQID